MSNPLQLQQSYRASNGAATPELKIPLSETELRAALLAAASSGNQALFDTLYDRAAELRAKKTVVVARNEPDSKTIACLADGYATYRRQKDDLCALGPYAAVGYLEGLISRALGVDSDEEA